MSFWKRERALANLASGERLRVENMPWLILAQNISFSLFSFFYSQSEDRKFYNSTQLTEDKLLAKASFALILLHGL